MKKSLTAFTSILIVLLLTPDAPATNTIPLNPERAGHTVTLLNSGVVLIAGGVNESATLTSALLYNPANQTFSATGNMMMARENHTATLLNDGRVLITGGDINNQATKTAELYDPVNGTFTLVTKQMSVSRTKHTASLLPDGRVLLVGGKIPICSILPRKLLARLQTRGTVLVTGGLSFPIRPISMTQSVALSLRWRGSHSGDSARPHCS